MQTIQGGMVYSDLVQHELIVEKSNLKDGAGKQHPDVQESYPIQEIMYLRQQY